MRDAVRLLATDPELLARERAQWSLVAVEDHQESTAATAALLDLVAGSGADLLVVGDPDATTSGFRGGDPRLLTGAATRYRRADGADAATVVLRTRWRTAGALAAAARAQELGLGLMVGCMLATSLSMAPAALLAGLAAYADLDGPLLLARDRELPELDSGALLAIGAAGAYGFAMSSNYNTRTRAAEVLVEGSKFQVIRQRETLGLMVAGLGNKEIAGRLGLSLNTVRNHVQNVLVKLDAHSKLEAVAIAAREGLVDRPS